MRALFVLTALTGCLDTAPTTDETVEYISGPSQPASQFQLDRASKIYGCTATRIDSRHLLTAMHCGTPKWSAVSFYDQGSGRDVNDTAIVVDFLKRPGTNVKDCHDNLNCYDSYGLWADVAVIVLDRDVQTGSSAIMAWEAPGSGVTGQKVGAGLHNDLPNPAWTLLQVTDTTSNTPNLGQFHTSHDWVNDQDSGGPFYVAGKIAGTLTGHQSGPGGYAIHTSVATHLDWILQETGWTWRGGQPIYDHAYTGTVVDMFFNTTERVCRYACENTTSCQGYNLLGSTCEVLTDIGTVYSLPGAISGLRFGSSSTRRGNVVGFDTNQSIATVLHPSNAGSIDEIVAGATNWQQGPDIPSGIPAPGSKLSAYKRADGTSVVVYRATNGHLIELDLTHHVANDMSAIFSPPPLAVDTAPVGFVNAEGISTILYRDTVGHIIDLELHPSNWQANDLSILALVPVAASSDPSGFVRSDGMTSIVFRSGTSIFELFKAQGRNWDWGEPSAFAPGAPAAAGTPFGYTQHDGIEGIVYRNASNGHMTELFLSGAWGLGEVGSIAGSGDPSAYVRNDGIEAVVYRAGSDIIEAANSGGWSANDLNALFGGQHTISDPSPYLRADGRNSVVFELRGNHAAEWSIAPGDSAWLFGDLTAITGETP
jgi:hypothetical protein